MVLLFRLQVGHHHISCSRKQNATRQTLPAATSSILKMVLVDTFCAKDMAVLSLDAVDPIKELQGYLLASGYKSITVQLFSTIFINVIVAAEFQFHAAITEGIS